MQADDLSAHGLPFQNLHIENKLANTLKIWWSDTFDSSICLDIGNLPVNPKMSVNASYMIIMLCHFFPALQGSGIGA